MIPFVLLCSSLLTTSPPETKPSDDALTTYQVAQAQAGRDADAHVRLALWCEAHGLNSERLKQLALAVLIDPGHAAARGLLGLVADDGQWRRPEAVAQRVQDDATRAAKLAQYNERRAQAKETAESQWNLAVWCEKQGLKAEAIAHFTAVTRLPSAPRPRRQAGIVGFVHPAFSADHREAAWKRLGYKEHNGRWMTAEQIAAEKAEREAQQKADRRWQPLLEKWQGWLADPGRRPEAETAMADVTDPRAVPAVCRVMGTGGPDHQLVAAQVLGQINAPAAARALAVLAVSGASPEVRQVATETLRRRDPRDFIGLLIDTLRTPLRYEVRPVGGPGSPGELFVEGERYNVRRTYAAPAIEPNRLLRLLYTSDVPADLFHFQSSWDPTGTFTAWSGDFAMAQTFRVPGSGGPTIDVTPDEIVPAPGSFFVPTYASLVRQRIADTERFRQEAQVATAVSQRRLSDDIAAVEATATAILQTNERVLLVLHGVTEQDLGTDRESWRRWWTDQQGYSYQTPRPQPKPTYSQAVNLPFTPSYARSWYHSCFGAGTPVLTQEGLRPIEALRVGDLVLTQDTSTGALSYQPIVKVYHNPPNATLRVALGSESILVTGIHRFWRAGRGWTMARDLKPGDSVRTLGSLATVASVETDTVQPVFNLEVAHGRSFFVGQAGALVHDNTLVEPTPEPFDAPPVLAVVTSDRVE
jgi:hypothetical protein